MSGIAATRRAGGGWLVLGQRVIIGYQIGSFARLRLQRWALSLGRLLFYVKYSPPLRPEPVGMTPHRLHLRPDGVVWFCHCCGWVGDVPLGMTHVCDEIPETVR